MKILFYIGLLLVSMELHAQFDRLTINFHPSFIENLNLIIKKEDKGYSLNIQIDNFKEMNILSDSSFITLKNFLNEYRFEHKSSVDTIGQEKVIEDGDTVIHHQVSIGFDGIDVSGELIENEKIKPFEFWSPRKDNVNHEFIEILFNIMYNHFESKKSVNYLEQLEQYFDFGLGLRKLNNNPLTYKLYGSISSREADELYIFFENLPNDKVILIDMSNFNGMGTMFDDDFLDLSKTHELIQWINCSEDAKKTFKRIRIDKKRYK